MRTGRITAQGVLATEARAEHSLLERVVDRERRLEKVFEHHPHATKDLGEKQTARRVLEHALLGRARRVLSQVAGIVRGERAD
jgi:hypothetical protein